MRKNDPSRPAGHASVRAAAPPVGRPKGSGSQKGSRGVTRTRATFRLDSDLVKGLRQLPNQTRFVEQVLREALGQICPLCSGTGEAPGVHLTVSDFKTRSLGRIDRGGAAQLKALVRLGRQLLATQLDLEAADAEQGLGFRLAREDQLLLSGVITSGKAETHLVQ